MIPNGFWNENWTAGIFNHLWQSTLVIFVAWLLTLTLQRNAARTRYWVWMASSLKLLVPFSLLAAMGGWLRPAGVPPLEGPQFTNAMIEMAHPFLQSTRGTGPVAATLASTTGIASSAHHIGLTEILVLLWLCGLLLLIVRRSRDAWSIRAMLRAAARVSLPMDVPVFLTSQRIGPGIVGIFHPVLLLPERVLQQLSAAQLRSILAHESCHVRRRDNLTAAMHMVVEAIFWFHPAVWWIERRLIEERERACDEAVLQLGNEAEVYAESLLNVCKFYTQSPIACVSGVMGSELKQRIVRIMTKQIALKLDMGRKLLLSSVAILAITVPVVFGILHITEAHAQSTPASPASAIAMDSDKAQPSFEVASIRVDHSGLSFNTELAPARFVMERWKIIDMVEYAYDVHDVQVIGGPKWINWETFDVDAKIPEADAEMERGLPSEKRLSRMRLRVRDLLAKRFGLRVHHSVERQAVLALVMADKQPKFAEAIPPQDSTTDRGKPRITMSMVGHEWVLKLENAPIRGLIAPLSGQPEIGGRVLVDQTGLTKSYDLTLRWKMQDLGAGDSTASEDAGATLFTALREQLGLKIESRDAPVDTVVIDHVERPSPN